MTTDDLTRGMQEIRLVAGGTRAAYEDIYAGPGIRHADRLSAWILALTSAEAGMRLLDVACGEGQLLRVAAARGLEAHGVDLSAAALGRAGAAPGVRAAVANGEALPYPADHFDIVTNLGSLEHYEDPLAGAAEMARVLKPDGACCLHVPNSFGLRWNVLHAWRYGDIHDDGQPIQRYATRRQWTRLLEAGGLAVERVLGYEDESTLPEHPADWPEFLRHPSRLLVPLARWLPVDMASLLVFVCRKA